MNVNQAIARARPSYVYCGICGATPKTSHDEPNYGPLKWWDCDDGWKIGTLCRCCADEALPRHPKPSDYADPQQTITVDNTDEDPAFAVYEIPAKK